MISSNILSNKIIISDKNRYYSNNNRLIVLSIVLFSFFSIFNTARYGASFSYVALPCALIIILFLLEKKAIRARSCLIFLLFSVYLISTFISPYVSIGSNIVTFFIFCSVYCAVVSFDYDSKSIKLIIDCYIIFAAICSLNIIYQWLTHHYYQLWVQRSSFYFFGVFKDPNYTMSYVMPAAFFSFAKLFSNKRKPIKVILLLLAIILFSLAVLATASRGAIVAFYFSCLFYFMFSNKVKIKQKIKLITLLIILTGGLAIIALKVLPQLAILRFTSYTDGAGRLYLWEAAMKCFYSNPLIGGGIDSGTAFSTSLVGNATHNVYIDILCDSGVIGSFLFIVFCFTNLVKSKKSNLHFQLACFIAFFVPLFFINGFNTTSFYLPIYFLGILSNYNTKNNFNDYL